VSSVVPAKRADDPDPHRGGLQVVAFEQNPYPYTVCQRRQASSQIVNPRGL